MLVLLKPHLYELSVDNDLPHSGDDSFDVSVKLKMLFDTQVREQCVELRAVPNELPCLRILNSILYIISSNADFSRCRINVPSQRLERRGLSSSINSEQSETLAETNTKGCIFNSVSSKIPVFVDLIEKVRSDFKLVGAESADSVFFLVNVLVENILFLVLLVVVPDHVVLVMIHSDRSSSAVHEELVFDQEDNEKVHDDVQTEEENVASGFIES
mmetsp:Transcript_19094/g.21992  ORF Transcript_19094/g.21992 Transcript_19094/m.21992 type:complete len:215 (+) Transcript_19094:855-1499(+)